ncbi:hypothetical protein ACQZ61_04260 [Agrobacterium vitis]|uniref:hypothetical protein n=1 Tax=Agrobacterium vitis TaxID=373 RepID=UPI001F46369E|nr:hypothetical protein [Agrobacterium vitis]MCF1452262.1 hypothetical protein [Agrobacterium vitis]
MARAAKPQKDQPPIKAYAVTETGEGTGGIFFARHAIVARRCGANEYGEGELSYVTCRRAPWADGYAKTDVPARVMVERGWRYNCSSCEMEISENEFENRRMNTAGILGMQNGPIYCCVRCKWRDIRLEQKSQALCREVFEIHKAIILKRLPGVKVLDLNARPSGSRVDVNYRRGGWDWYHVDIQFEFPGMSVAPASMMTRRDYGERAKFTPPRPQFYYCGGDKVAFEAFAAACKEPS